MLVYDRVISTSGKRVAPHDSPEAHTGPNHNSPIFYCVCSVLTACRIESAISIRVHMAHRPVIWTQGVLIDLDSTYRKFFKHLVISSLMFLKDCSLPRFGIKIKSKPLISFIGSRRNALYLLLMRFLVTASATVFLLITTEILLGKLVGFLRYLQTKTSPLYLAPLS